jgi:hypothetical protein
MQAVLFHYSSPKDFRLTDQSCHSSSLKRVLFYQEFQVEPELYLARIIQSSVRCIGATTRTVVPRVEDDM